MERKTERQKEKEHKDKPKRKMDELTGDWELSPCVSSLGVGASACPPDHRSRGLRVRGLPWVAGASTSSVASPGALPLWARLGGPPRGEEVVKEVVPMDAPKTGNLEYLAAGLLSIGQGALCRVSGEGLAPRIFCTIWRVVAWSLA